MQKSRIKISEKVYDTNQYIDMSSFKEKESLK